LTAGENQDIVFRYRILIEDIFLRMLCYGGSVLGTPVFKKFKDSASLYSMLRSIRGLFHFRIPYTPRERYASQEFGVAHG
jgi:hypothetical protein